MFTIWLSGPKFSGKTSLAKSLNAKFLEGGWEIELLDKDFFGGLEKDILFKDNAMISYLCKVLNDHNMICVVSGDIPVSEREKVRAIVGRDVFVLVYLSCSKEVLQSRSLGFGEFVDEGDRYVDMVLDTSKCDIFECTKILRDYVLNKFNIFIS